MSLRSPVPFVCLSCLDLLSKPYYTIIPTVFESGFGVGFGLGYDGRKREEGLRRLILVCLFLKSRYYEGGTSSAYLWNLDDGFAGVVLLKKSTTPSSSTAKGSSSSSGGSWDSIHVLEVLERGRTAKYKLTSTVILNLGSTGEALGELDLSGNMTRQVETDMPVDGDQAHVVNIGKMVEDMELKMRNLLRITPLSFGLWLWQDDR